MYNYCLQFPDKLFEGACYVFDDRMTVSFQKDGSVPFGEDIPVEKAITNCLICDKKSARVIDDDRDGKRTQVVCCKACDDKLEITLQSNGKLMKQQIKSS